MTTFNCTECEETYDTDNGGVYSNIKESYFCDDCYASDLDNSSTITFVTANGAEKVLIGDAFRVTEYGDEYDNQTIERQWVKTGEWRGHFDTTIDGYDTVLTGWTTGGWGDPIADRKQVFNDWAEEVILGELIPPCKVAIITDPTSNLFSTAITVQVPKGSQELFNEWLEQTGYSLSDLHDSLS